MSKLSKFFTTIKYLKFSQICQRIKIYLKRKTVSPSRYQRQYCISAQQLSLLRNIVREKVNRESFQNPSTFNFLNERVDVQGSWFPDSVSPLWLYNLHYFDYLFDIEDYKVYWQLIESWLDQVEPVINRAWHPYTTSLRICNWIFSFCAKYSSEDLDNINHSLLSSFLDSLYNQTRYIEDFLEFDVLGNHLLENCKALIVSGSFFKNEAWVRKGLVILEKQLEEQVLADGGHYERSPMYHCIVLEDLLQVRTALIASNMVTFVIDENIKKMALFLANIIEADNSIPLLNDSAFKICLDPLLLLNEVTDLFNVELPEFNKSHYLKDFGLFVIRSPKLSLTFDIGKSCPDFLPAHAHSDLLSYTLFLNNIPVVTDSGTYEYTNGPWRNLFRETASHNTIKIDNIDLIDTWSSFRVGRRGYPEKIIVSADNKQVKCIIDNFYFIGVSVSRTISVVGDNAGIIVCDEFMARNGVHKYSNYLQLHPELCIGKAERLGSVLRLFLMLGNCVSAYLFFESSTAYNIDFSWYSEEFGKKTKRIRLMRNGEFPKGKFKSCYAIVSVNASDKVQQEICKEIMDA